MKNKPLVDYESFDITQTCEFDTENTGHPLIVPTQVWRNTVINFDHLFHSERRALQRVRCYGYVSLLNKRGKIVGSGDLRDLNEKSGGFTISACELSLNDILYLEFIRPADFLLSQVKVILKRIQVGGKKTVIGVEFIDKTPAFENKLDLFLKAKRSEPGFNDDRETI